MRTGCQWLLTDKGARYQRPSRPSTSALLAICLLLISIPKLAAEEPAEGTSSRSARSAALHGIPYHRMKNSVASQIQSVVEHPSFFRRMPTEQIECDPALFTFMVRRPEVMVSIWQVMGITKVTAKRINDYSFIGDDGAGTICRCDLVYSSQNLHIYLGDGSYDGSMAPRKVTGNCVCILRTDSDVGPDGKSIVRGTMDVFLKLDNFGADLLARSVAPFIGKTADYNFAETAKFIAQISQVCELSPAGARNLASKLSSIHSQTRDEFAQIAGTIATRSRPSASVSHGEAQWQAAPANNRIPSPIVAAPQSPAAGSSYRLEDRSASPLPLAQASPRRLAPIEAQPEMELNPSTRSQMGLSDDRNQGISNAAPPVSRRSSDLADDLASEFDAGWNVRENSLQGYSRVRPIKPQIFMRR